MPRKEVYIKELFGDVSEIMPSDKYFALVYGSRASGMEKGQSDLDFFVAAEEIYDNLVERLNKLPTTLRSGY